ncbi:MAG: hypothetical protein ACI901_000358, partial [Octadecabacter sp.]
TFTATKKETGKKEEAFQHQLIRRGNRTILGHPKLLHLVEMDESIVALHLSNVEE